MIKRLRLLIAMVFVLPLLSTGIAVAQADDSGDSSETTQSSDDTTSPEDEDKPKTEGREDRLEKLKTKQAERLTKVEETKIKAKCKASQGKITSAQSRFTSIRTSRKNIYKEIGEKLSKLVDRLKAKGIDTSKLDVALADIKVKADEFSALATSYEQTLADLSAMDCTADPEAFKAALESAREDRKSIAEKADELRDYIKTTLKPIIAELKTALSASNSTDGTQESGATQEGTN